MELWHAIVLGIVQGLTEFLPVSSSGHLVLVRELLPGIETGERSSEAVLFAVSVHVGTLFSVVIYFHKRLLQLLAGMFRKPMTREHWTVLFLTVATIPAGIAGVTLKKHFETAFDSPLFTSCMLIVTGLLLVLPLLIKVKPRPAAGGPDCQGEGEVNLLAAIIMGVGQAFAILPGISRSGSTIASGMLAGVNPSKAAEFSFLMAIPAISAGGLLTLLKVDEMPEGMALNCGIGALFAFVTGLIAVYWVLDSIRRGKFQYFALYCALVGVAGVIYFGFFKS